MKRLARYHAVAEQLIADGQAYRCWCTPEELDAMLKGIEAISDRADVRKVLSGELEQHSGTIQPVRPPQ